MYIQIAPELIEAYLQKADVVERYLKYKLLKKKRQKPKFSITSTNKR